MTGNNIESPTILTFALSDTLPVSADGRTLRGLDIWANGDVKITDTSGTTITRSFVAPFRWIVQIRQVWNAGTTVAVGSLDGLV